MLGRWKERGDTLIEVLFAFSILSLIVVGALAIMNQGTVASQRSLETTLVRQEIDAQATTLRFLHDAYVAKFQPGINYAADTPAGQWKLMTDSLTATQASTFGGVTTCPTPPQGSFILDASNAKYLSVSNGVFEPASTYAQTAYNSVSNLLEHTEGIWIEGIRSSASGDANQTNTRYIDFHIRACWDSPGQGPPITLGTIVRLYEPRG